MPETQVIVEGAANYILNGLLQSDLDAAGFRILNLDTSNLSVGAGPISFPAQANKWLNSYDSVARLFTATQPATTNLSDFPALAGHSGQFLSNNGTALIWGLPQGATFINVKQAPYNAAGDGVTDDYAAINQALIDAAGRGVYLPKGTYLVSQPLTATGAVSLLGDNQFQSVIRLDPAASGSYVLQVPSGSVVTRMGFDASLNLAVQPAAVGRVGLQILNAAKAAVFSCAVSNCSGTGIQLLNCYGVVVRDCLIINCGGYGIRANGSPRSLIAGNKIQSTILSGILAVNAPNSVIANNQVSQCGHRGYGIGMFDSDNSAISDNVVQQSLVGIGAGVTSSHYQQRPFFGYAINGNNVQRNYYGGILLILASGSNISGNVVASNGQGGTDNLTYTVEPGIMVDSANLGSGYQAGNVLTLTGGSGTPAKVLVLATGAGGSLLPDGLAIITPGAYTTFPSNPVPCSGGSGSGAKMILTGTLIASGGTSYIPGQVLAANVGTFYSPVRVLVTSVDVAGGVTGYQILNGGGYFGTLPSPLIFTNDAFSGPGGILSITDPDVVSPGVNFTLTPSWGLRYSQPQNGQQSYGISTVGAVNGGIIGDNIIADVKTGTGILFRDDVAPYSGRATWMCVTGNNINNNLYAIKGATGYALDDTLDPDSVIDNNIIYPPII